MYEMAIITQLWSIAIKDYIGFVSGPTRSSSPVPIGISPPPPPEAFIHTSLFNRDSFFNQIDIAWNNLPLTSNLRHMSTIFQKQLYEYSFDNSTTIFDINASVKHNFLCMLFLWRPELENQRWKIIIYCGTLLLPPQQFAAVIQSFLLWHQGSFLSNRIFCTFKLCSCRKQFVGCLWSRWFITL